MEISPRLSAFAMILLLLITAPARAAIYRCPGHDGQPRFTQFPCGEDARVVLEPTQIVELPPLSATEQAQLDALARERAQRREARARARHEAARAAGRERQAREARCRQARTGLEALERQRRKGYSLGESRALDRRESDLKAAARANC